MTKGVFLIDSSGLVTWTDREAPPEADDSVRVVRGRIIAVHPGQQQALDAALQQAIGPSDAPQPLSITIKSGDGTTRQIIHVIPMRRPKERSLADTAACAMMFVTDPNEGLTVRPELLQEQLGLTPSESRLAAAVASGERLKCSAQRLGLTEESARVILKRVFSKTGVGRQSELVTLVSRLTSVHVPN